MIFYGTYLHCAIFLFNKLHFRRRIGEILGVDTYHTLYYNRGIDGEWRIHPMFADQSHAWFLPLYDGVPVFNVTSN
jgi:hypothetical protein